MRGQIVANMYEFKLVQLALTFFDNFLRELFLWRGVGTSNFPRYIDVAIRSLLQIRKTINLNSLVFLKSTADTCWP